MSHRIAMSDVRKGHSSSPANIPQLSEMQKVWLACAIDTEGSILVTHHHYPSGSPFERWYFCIEVSNTDMPFIEHVGQIVQERVRWMKPKENRKQAYMIKVGSAPKIFGILQQIIPYLIVKRNKAIEACSHIGRRFGLR